jgi:phytoene synthase
MTIRSVQPRSVVQDAAIKQDHPIDASLADAYAHCRRITRDASKSFFLAAALLPSPKRQAIEALYAFARTSDNTVDEQQEPATALADWLTHLHSATTSQDPTLRAWHDTSTRYCLPMALADELLAGVGMDLTINRYQTFEELQLYCYRVASVVGLLSMHIIGYETGAEPYAIQLGTALQLTNILRDVGEDAARGRIYLPLEDLERFGLCEGDILNGVQDRRFRSLMHWQIARAERLYQASWPGISLLHRDGQFAVAAAALLYRAILPKIVANNFDVFSRRAFVSTREKLLLLPRIWRQLGALQRGDTVLPALKSLECCHV